MTTDSAVKKRILVLGCKNYPAFSSTRIISGGMEVYVWELLKRLKDEYAFSLIAGYSHSDDADVTIINVPIFGKFALQPITLTIYSFFVSLFLVMTGQRIELVNAQTPLSGMVALALKKLFRIPYVVTVHIFASDEGHVGRLSKLYGPIERIVLRHADKVVSAGYQLKEFLDARYGFPADHVMVINPGMDLPDRLCSRPGGRIAEVVAETSFKMLFLGRLIEENGILDLLEAVKLLKEKSLKLYIAGNGNLEPVIEDFIRREELQGKIRMLGVVTGNDKAHLIRNVDLSVRTSYHEVFPVAYLESIACGVPVIATPAGDTEYLADRSGAISIVPMHDPRKIAEAIELKMKQGPLPSEAIERGRTFIRSLSWNEQAKRTARVFEDVLIRKKEPQFCVE